MDNSGIKIKKLNKENMSFKVIYKKLENEIEKSFDDELIGEWLEEPILYGAFNEENLLGFIEVSKESWNNRLRVSNLLVFEPNKSKNIGTLLMNEAKKYAMELHTRAFVLKTQSRNEKAISFYLKNGFVLIGLDTINYTN